MLLYSTPEHYAVVYKQILQLIAGNIAILYITDVSYDYRCNF